MVDRAKRRDFERLNPSFSQEDFVKWSLNNEAFLMLFYIWTNSGYRKWLAPSVDRINDALCYSFENVQWVSWAENYNKECLKKGYSPFAKGQPIHFEKQDEEEIDWL